MFGHLRFQSGLHHPTDQPSQQAALTGQLDPISPGLLDQRVSHFCQIG